MKTNALACALMILVAICLTGCGEFATSPESISQLPSQGLIGVVDPTTWQGTANLTPDQVTQALQGTWKSPCLNASSREMRFNGSAFTYTIRAHSNYSCTGPEPIPDRVENYTITVEGPSPEFPDGYRITYFDPETGLPALYYNIKINGTRLANGNAVGERMGHSPESRPNQWEFFSYSKQP